MITDEESYALNAVLGFRTFFNGIYRLHQSGYSDIKGLIYRKTTTKQYKYLEEIGNKLQNENEKQPFMQILKRIDEHLQFDEKISEWLLGWTGVKKVTQKTLEKALFEKAAIVGHHWTSETEYIELLSGSEKVKDEGLLLIEAFWTELRKVQ